MGLRLGLRFSSRQKVISPIRCVQQRGTSFVETFGTDAPRMVRRAIAGNKRREYRTPSKQQCQTLWLESGLGGSDRGHAGYWSYVVPNFGSRYSKHEFRQDPPPPSDAIVIRLRILEIFHFVLARAYWYLATSYRYGYSNTGQMLSWNTEVGTNGYST